LFCHKIAQYSNVRLIIEASVEEQAVGTGLLCRLF